MIRWVVQTNLGKQYAEDLELACKKLDYEFKPVLIIPFCDRISDDIDNNKPTIFYGATRWIDNIYKQNIWKPGVFFNPKSIYSLWSQKYGEHSLNYGARQTTLAELSKENHPQDELMFIRPVSDQKEFAGDVMKFRHIKQWSNKLTRDSDIDLDTVPIITASPVGIAHEWRLFIVDGKVSSGSHYRTYHKFQTSSDVPKEVIEFAEERTKEYSPAPVFVMDIGKSGDALYVIEIGCFNSAGFYDSDVEKIVYDVSQYIIENGLDAHSGVQEAVTLPSSDTGSSNLSQPTTLA